MSLKESANDPAEQTLCVKCKSLHCKAGRPLVHGHEMSKLEDEYPVLAQVWNVLRISETGLCKELQQFFQSRKLERKQLVQLGREATDATRTVGHSSNS